MLRQRRLTSDQDPLALVAIVDEPALTRPVGGATVMRAQLAHLLRVAALPRITLHVLPLDVGAHEGLDGAFTVLRFADCGEPDIAYIEHSAGSLQVSREREVTRATLTFDRLRSAALSPADSIGRVSEVLDRM